MTCDLADPIDSALAVSTTSSAAYVRPTNEPRVDPTDALPETSQTPHNAAHSEPTDRADEAARPGATISRAEAANVLIAALLRLLTDLATPGRALVSAVNALLALERQRLAGRVGLAGLLVEEVRLTIIAALTRVLADEAAPARTTIAAANSLLALERNRLRAERQQQAIVSAADPSPERGPPAAANRDGPALEPETALANDSAITSGRLRRSPPGNSEHALGSSSDEEMVRFGGGPFEVPSEGGSFGQPVPSPRHARAMADLGGEGIGDRATVSQKG
jgi:hypothetical protein